MFTHFFGGFGGNRKVFITLSASEADYDLYVDAGSPTDPVDIVVTIQAATEIYSSVTSIPAFSLGTGWAAGSTLKIINNGKIIGVGGKGGRGGVSSPTCNDSAGNVGFVGGDALDLTWDVTIDNTNGNIYGGGGGGGGGATDTQGTIRSTGGGGGGGAGRVDSVGGFAGLAIFCSGGNNGFDGGVGNTVGGTGGAGGGLTSGADGGDGGDGGGYGTAGSDGTQGHSGAAAGLGGGAGKAAELNGNTITWLGGSSSPNVEGAVS